MQNFIFDEKTRLFCKKKSLAESGDTFCADLLKKYPTLLAENKKKTSDIVQLLFYKCTATKIS